MSIIAFCNQKGGVGKSFSSWAMACQLQHDEYKVLACDLDPQSTLTDNLIDDADNISPTLLDLMMAIIENRVCDYKTSNNKEIYFYDEIYEENSERKVKRIEFTVEDVIKNTTAGVDLLPSSINLNGIDILLVSAVKREFIFKRIISQVSDEYDYIILDCSPYLGLQTLNALCAADEVIIPHNATKEAQRGFQHLIDSIIDIKKNLNEKLTINGILFTLLRPNEVLQKQMISSIQEAYGEYLYFYNAKIMRTAEAERSIAFMLPLHEACPKNSTAIAYKEFCDEFLSRRGDK